MEAAREAALSLICDVEKRDVSREELLERLEALASTLGRHESKPSVRFPESFREVIETDKSARTLFESLRDVLAPGVPVVEWAVQFKDYLCLASPTGHYLHLNNTWSERLGWSTEELCAVPFVEFVHPDDRASTFAVHADNMNGRNVVDFENRYECKDGSYRMLSWMSVVCPDTKRVAAIATDITDHRHQLQVLYRLMIQGNYGSMAAMIQEHVVAGCKLLGLEHGMFVRLDSKPANASPHQSNSPPKPDPTAPLYPPSPDVLCRVDVCHHGLSTTSKKCTHSSEPLPWTRTLCRFSLLQGEAIVFAGMFEEAVKTSSPASLNCKKTRANGDDAKHTDVENFVSTSRTAIMSSPGSALRQKKRVVCALFSEPVRAFISCPVVVHGRLHGMLVFASAEGDTSTNVELDLADKQYAMMTAASITQQIEKKLIEDERNRSASSHAALYMLSPDLLSILKPDGSIIRVNSRWTEILGWSEARLLERPLQDFIKDHQGRGLWRSSVNQLLHSQSPETVVEFVCKFNRKSGGSLLLSCRAALDRGNGLLILSARDVSQEKEYQAELERAKAQALRANQAKSDFLSSMSHEIRTPMNGVTGMAFLLAQTPLSPIQLEYVNSIRISAEHLVTVINDILDFSKIESGKMDLELIPVDVYRCVEQAIELAYRPADYYHLRVCYHVADDVPNIIIGDVTRLRQILTNLLSNAFKFTAEGHITVTVKVMSRPQALAMAKGASMSPNVSEHKQDDNGPVAVFTCTDTGPGIPADARAKLFRAFTQANSSVAREYGGSGLGLAICSRLAFLMGGRMWVDTEVGVGSSFHLMVPTYTASPDARLPVSTFQRVDATVLLIDSDSVTSAALSASLNQWGLKVTLAESIEEARRILRSDQCMGFDVIVLDWKTNELLSLYGSPKASASTPAFFGNIADTLSSPSDCPKSAPQALRRLRAPAVKRALSSASPSPIDSPMMNDSPLLMELSLGNTQSAQRSVLVATRGLIGKLLQKNRDLLAEHRPSQAGVQHKRRLIFLAAANTEASPQMTHEDAEYTILRHPVKLTQLHSHVLSACNSSLASKSTTRSPQLVARSQLQLKSLRLRVLVVEDTRINRRVVSRMLANMGLHDVSTAVNGHMALSKTKKTHFDVILMDVQMPGMGGLECARHIRKWYEGNRPNLHPVIIALTANAMKGDRERCLEAGMDDYLAKPLQYQELLDKMAFWGGTRNGAIPSPIPQAPPPRRTSAMDNQTMSSKEALIASRLRSLALESSDSPISVPADVSSNGSTSPRPRADSVPRSAASSSTQPTASSSTQPTASSSTPPTVDVVALVPPDSAATSNGLNTDHQPLEIKKSKRRARRRKKRGRPPGST